MEYSINQLLSSTRYYIRDKVKVVLDLSDYATKKELEHARDIDTSDLATKKRFNFLES